MKPKKINELYRVLMWIILGSILIMCILSAITLKRHVDARKQVTSGKSVIQSKWGRMNSEE